MTWRSSSEPLSEAQKTSLKVFPKVRLLGTLIFTFKRFVQNIIHLCLIAIYLQRKKNENIFEVIEQVTCFDQKKNEKSKTLKTWSLVRKSRNKKQQQYFSENVRHFRLFLEIFRTHFSGSITWSGPFSKCNEGVLDRIEVLKRWDLDLSPENVLTTFGEIDFWVLK